MLFSVSSVTLDRPTTEVRSPGLWKAWTYKRLPFVDRVHYAPARFDIHHHHKGGQVSVMNGGSASAIGRGLYRCGVQSYTPLFGKTAA